ncbi:hypothetical protein NDU88_006762 [Pleurodeles waltl]|uniref:Uncharacterized protein n=1 Tax=Pleurodeles waltl TaxID=8319 RepID=A0AAV7WBP2_PLEWA|nr:hypothetical protein NDU88_006762 [Pleurodeles waltl]
MTWTTSGCVVALPLRGIQDNTENRRKKTPGLRGGSSSQGDPGQHRKQKEENARSRLVKCGNSGAPLRNQRPPRPPKALPYDVQSSVLRCP